MELSGVKPVRAALDAVTLPPDIMRALWSSRSAPPLIIGVSYVIVGIVSFLYTERDPFWLLFLTQGVLLLGSTWVFTRGEVLNRSPWSAVRSPRTAVCYSSQP